MPQENILNEAQFDLFHHYENKYEHILENNIGQKRIEIYNNYKAEAIKPKTILYETFHGKSLTDNPYAIFKNLIINKKFSDYQHIWVINDDEPYEEYKKIKNVKFVSVNSNEYLYCLATSKYLINNTSFPPYFLKRKEQVYLNTWHGTPLKTLGKDMKGPLEQLKNLQRNFIQADYILSPNKFTTEKLTSSHNLVGIYNGEVLETGYPRIDLITETKEKEILTKLENYIKLDKNKKIALYAPTWRGNVGEEKDIKKEIKDIIKNMKDSLDESYQLVLKVHPLLYKFFKNDSELGDIFIPDFIDMCEILSIVDLLITDYSSVFFDFYVKNKPIILYTYDKEDYLRERGTYLDFNELGCHIANNQKELNQLIGDPDALEGCSIKKFIEWQDGSSTEKVIDVLFNGKTNVNYAKKIDNKKENILVFIDEFNDKDIENKIAFVNSMSKKDSNIIVLTKSNLKYEEEEALKKLKNIKLFFRFGKLNVNKKLWIDYMLSMKQENPHLSEKNLEQVSLNEINRLLGYIDINKIYNLSSDKFWKNILGNFPIFKELKHQYLNKDDIELIKEDDFFFNKIENKNFNHFISFEASALTISNENKDIQFVYYQDKEWTSKNTIKSRDNRYFIPILTNAINDQFIMIYQKILDERFILVDAENKSFKDIMNFYDALTQGILSREERIIIVNVDYIHLEMLNQEMKEKDLVFPKLKEKADFYQLIQKAEYYFVLDDLKNAYSKIAYLTENGINVKVCDESFINEKTKLGIEYIPNWEVFLPFFNKYELPSSRNIIKGLNERVGKLDV
ncbi:hypothetical protein BTZ13_02065 [Staphylococcus condimenti]|uniref:CDP-glycerol glycerophosphotransferase family protein n=1 Tax=Staphylococcus TaxID=1279 RepID=UPI0008A355E0|nr:MULTISPECIES: CDP-glycerol glycerophosphotransferase family protein [Staphylococcus]APR60053.1 hypothetical protein BTZ13_02065 [Staphylococcus condimenti]MDK8645242.1 CDP-glycerol glycerophosphotransferase family protein [Staphylococcus condimenti]OFO99471.1 hypothetical protein HMPREF3007_12455 [Staphylococcus sp. HMSC065E08]